MESNSSQNASFLTGVEILRRYCAFQERTAEDVRIKAQKLNFSADDAEKAVIILKDEGYLDEKRYLNAYISGKINHNRWGKRKIREQLKLKKIDSASIDNALNEIDNQKYRSVLDEVIRKKAALLKEKDKKKAFMALMRYALSKGYEYETARNAVNEILKNNDF